MPPVRTATAGPKAAAPARRATAPPKPARVRVKKAPAKPGQRPGGPAREKPGAANTPAGPAKEPVLRMIPVHAIATSGLNPNRFTGGQRLELEEEVAELGQQLKPVVVRRVGRGYVIIDGEQTYNAARGLGWTRVWCQVQQADDFEAMRQMYVRNKRGQADPVRLGELFARMMRERALGQRELAKRLRVAEGTVRNYVQYVDAARLRDAYAPGEGEKVIARRSIHEVREYLKLSKEGEEGAHDAWLDEQIGLPVRAPAPPPAVEPPPAVARAEPGGQLVLARQQPRVVAVEEPAPAAAGLANGSGWGREDEAGRARLDEAWALASPAARLAFLAECITEKTVNDFLRRVYRTSA